MNLLTDLQGNSNGVFELYTNLNATGTLNFYGAQDAGSPVFGAGANAGTVAAGVCSN